jgi:hypothetical protein
MRGLMIIASVVLAGWQAWTFLPEDKSLSIAADAAVPRVAPAAMSRPKLIPAVVTGPVKALTLKAKAPASGGMESCYAHYRESYAECSPGNQSCQIAVGDRWDLCEATGFWR